MPKFSVIIPAYNSEKYIARCLNSVYSQTFKDFECVVVADSCTDNTAKIAKDYGAKVIEAQVRNDGLSRNIGMENSIGEWILFIDSDDYWLHEYVFQQLVDRINSVDADVICFAMVWKHIGVVGAVSNRNKMLFPHCTNKCWRRTVIGNTRFPNKKPDSDAGFHDLMMAKKPRLDIYDMPMYYYDFLRDESFSKSIGRTAEQAKSYWCINNTIPQQSTLRFSVIIPAHNAQDRFRKTLDSIKKQTFQNFEIIIVCDSCSDNTIKLAREYTNKVIEVNNHNPTFSRRDGLKFAKGEYVLFTDDDDWWLHEFVFEQLDAKLREENPDILYFSFIYKNYNYISPVGGQYLPAFWDKCWKRDFIEKIEFDCEDIYMGDVEFQENALAKSPKIVEWDMPLYYYDYMRPGSMTSTRGW